MADKILNTGLDALLGDVAAPNKQSIKEIDLTQIKPNRFQPRQSFDEQKIKELSQSIAKHGILSPILVRETHLLSLSLKTPISGKPSFFLFKISGCASVTIY